MNVQESYFWFAVGLAIGISTQSIARAILSRLGGRTESTNPSPKKIIVVLEREALDRVAEAVSNSVIDATQRHIDALKKPSKN